ncbi:hypothetical protein DKX38_018929 [Salix brachista]|uniref:Sey1/RHD3-like three-helix bundle domain-containing protein n=1 Tax=Salix brachista TaxID=2182728 RepID=A0A5N5KPE8_9ROSI|nr:hypothetical protein DKX38_018929 [Salix brachista]
MKAREEADAGRILKCMMDRSKQVFDNYENSMSWYKSETNLDEIERKALSKSLRILSIMAAIRYDEMPDQIENVLYSSLMDRIVLNPSLQKTPMEAVMDPLALDTWEEVSQNSTTLLKPEDCGSLWMMFIEEIKPMVTDVKSRQDARKKTRSYVVVAAGVAAVVAGPAVVVNVGIAVFRRAIMRM